MVALKSLDPDTLELPLSRIGSASNAVRMVRDLIDRDITRGSRRTKIQGIIDGNAPWSHGTLRAKGQGHRTSLNVREAEGNVEAAKIPYYDLVFEVPRFANINLDFDFIDPEVNFMWSEIWSEEFTKMLRRWRGFDSLIQLHQYQMVVYGLGPIFWPHSVDWRPQAGKAGRILVPDRTRADVDRFDRMVILHSYSADELWRHVKGKQDLKDATAQGWNPELCKEEIMRVGKHAFGPTSEWKWDDWQTAFRNGDLYTSFRCEDVPVASLYVKEFSGKISHYIVTIDNTKDASDILTQTQLQALLQENESTDDIEVGYLFKAREKYESFAEIVCPFFYDVGPDGTMHSIKGLGPKIYDFCDVSNRMTSQMIDGAILGSGVAVEAQDANALSETQVALFGGVAVFAPGLKVVQTRIAEALNGALAVRRDLQNTLQSNTGQYRQRVSGEQQEPTLGQAQLNAQQQAMLSKGSVNRYYVSLNGFYKEILRRILLEEVTESTPGGKEALAFRKACIRRGFPEEYMTFDHVQDVEAVPSLGYGSPQMRDISSQALMQLLPMMDETARNTALRLRVCAIPGLGQQAADVFFPSVKQKGFPEDHAALATLENNDLNEIGGKVLVTAQQNHPTHFQIHFADAMGDLKGLQQGALPLPQALIRLENKGPHMKQHLDKFAQDPSRKGQVKQFSDAWLNLSKVTDKLKAQAAQQQANQPPQQPQLDPETMTALEKVHGELDIKKQKMQGDMGLKAQKQAATLRLADQKTAADIRRANAAAGHGIRRSNVQTAADIARSNASTTADIHQANVDTLANIRRADMETLLSQSVPPPGTPVQPETGPAGP